MVETLKTEKLEQLRQLLDQFGLPSSDVETAEWFKLLGINDAGRLVSAAGLEHCDGSLLLRSVVTDPAFQGKGMAAEIVSTLNLAAKKTGYEEIWMLTIDADRYFSHHHDFHVVTRSDAPEGIRCSAQFRGLCPADAILMRRRLN
ncbi:MAG: GNAT family N-acetyltransferase [Arenicellales bacterium]